MRSRARPRNAVRRLRQKTGYDPDPGLTPFKSGLRACV